MLADNQVVRSAVVQGYVAQPPAMAPSGGAGFTANAARSSQNSSNSNIPNKFAFERVWGQQGSPGPSPDQPLAMPLGIAVGPANPYVHIYVVDAGNHSIKEYYEGGSFIQSWGHASLSPGGFDMPVGVAVSPDGSVAYVTDSSRQKVLKFATSTGTFTGEWGDATMFNGPKGIAVDGPGNVYVVDSGNGRVQKFDATGNYLATIGSMGSGNGQFTSPYAIAFAPTGEFYVSDIGADTVQKFDASGNFLIGWGVPGTDSGQFRSPRGITVDPSSGNVYVVDSDNARLQVFDSAGNFLSQAGSFGTDPGQFNGPEGIVFDVYGQFFIVDVGNQRVQWFSNGGQFQGQFGPIPVPPDPNTAGGYFQRPPRLAQDDQGHEYVVDQNNHRIQKFDAAGNFLLGMGGQGNADGQMQAPMAVAVSPDGATIYVSDNGNNRIQAFDSAGAFQRKWAVSSLGTGMAVDGQGFVYIMAGGLIQKYLPDGTFVRTIGSSGTGPGQFRFLYDIAIERGTARLYTLDLTQGLQVFDLDGNLLDTFLPAGQTNYFRGLAVDSQGSVYLTSSGGFRKFAPDKTFIASWSKFGDASQPDTFETPYGITIDPGQHVYVTDIYLNRVSRFQQGFALPPTAVPGPDRTVPVYLLTTLDGSASHDNGLGYLVSWNWHFSDGTPDQSGAVVQHRFYRPGVYTATLTVTDDDENTASATAHITVSGGPTAVITANTLQAAVGQPLSFDGSGSADPLASITDYGWTFGDGASASGAGVTHAFLSPGSFQVSLTVQDGTNLTGQASVTVQVTSRIHALAQALDQVVANIPSASVEKQLMNDLNKLLKDYDKTKFDKAIKAVDSLIKAAQADLAKGKLDAATESQIVQAARQIIGDLVAQEKTASAKLVSVSTLTGTAGRLLDDPLSVTLTDSNGKSVLNEPVEFRIVSGQGTLLKDWDLDTVTDAQGRAGMRFLCPADLRYAAGKSPLTRIQAIHRAINQDTGEREEQVIAVFTVQTAAPRLVLGSAQTEPEVPQQNASVDTYTMTVSDALGQPLADQGIECVFTDTSNNVLASDLGIILPRSQATDAAGLVNMGYVAKSDTPTGTPFHIKATPMPRVIDENASEVALSFPTITVVQKPDHYDLMDVREGNGQVLIPGTKSNQRLLTHVIPQDPYGRLDFTFYTDARNNMEVVTGTSEASGYDRGNFYIIVGGDADQDAAVKPSTDSVRKPQAINVFVSGITAAADLAVGEPEVYLVTVDSATGDSVPAQYLLPTALSDLQQGMGAQYYLEARMPVGASAPTGGVVSLDAGKNTELPQNPNTAVYAAATSLTGIMLDQSRPVPAGDETRYTLWRSSQPLKVANALLAKGQAKPALPGQVVQAAPFGAIRPFLNVAGTAYPEGRLKGVPKPVAAFQLEEELFLQQNHEDMTFDYAPHSVRRLTKYEHLGIVTPLIEIDRRFCQIASDRITVRGRILSTLHMLSDVNSSARPIVAVETLTSDATVDPFTLGVFTFEAPDGVLHEADQVIHASAYNVCGGFGQDLITVTSDNAVHDGKVYEDTCRPVLNRIVLGRDDALLQLSPITVRTRSEGRDATLTLIRREDGMVVSQPFVVTDTNSLGDPSQIATLSSDILLSMTSDLNDEVVVQFNGTREGTFPMAGAKVLDPAPFSITTVSEGEAKNGKGRKISLQVRNVALHEPRVSVTFFGIDLGPNQRVLSVPAFPSTQFNNTQVLVTNAVKFLPGRARILTQTVDLDGREVLDCSETAFHFDESSLMQVQEISPGMIAFPLIANVDDKALSAELGRLNLKIVGRIRFAEDQKVLTEADVDDVLLVQPPDGCVRRAVGAIMKSPLRAVPDGQEAAVEQEVFTNPFLNLFGFFKHLANGTSWAEEQKQRNNSYRDALRRATDQNMPSHSFLVADMRIKDPHIDTHGLGFLGRNPDANPDFLFTDGGQPSFRLRRYTAVGVDENREGTLLAPFAPVVGQPPRIGYTVGPDLQLADVLPTSTSTILQIHGFNEVFTDTSDSQGNLIVGGDSDTLRNTIPFSQYLLYRKDGVPLPTGGVQRLDSAQYPVIHVVWTGNYSRKEKNYTGLWFNVDYKLAHLTGQQVLANLVRQIKSRPGPAAYTTLLPQSAGNRVVASALGALGKDAAPPKQIRCVLVHPALRQPDMALTKAVPDTEFPKTALPLDFKTADPSILFYSMQDKTGVAFKKAQGVPMLGREGLPATYKAEAMKDFDLKGYIANNGNAFQDRWHVTLFGQVIPDMLDYSRPIYSLNGGITGIIGVSRTRHHIINYKGAHLNPIWDAIANYIQHGTRPGTVP